MRMNPSLHLIAAMCGLAVAACSSPTTPGVQPQIHSLTDSFEFQVSSVSNYSGTLTYTFTNSGTQATVNQASSVTTGTATLVLLDAAGKQLYSHPLSDNGTFLTDVGTAGTWTIRVQMSGASGTFNFRAQKKT